MSRRAKQYRKRFGYFEKLSEAQSAIMAAHQNARQKRPRWMWVERQGLREQRVLPGVFNPKLISYPVNPLKAIRLAKALTRK